jgi:hypothetical protein
MRLSSTCQSEEDMPHSRHDRRTIDRRSFVKASLIPAAFPIAAALANHLAHSAEQATSAVPAGPDIIDSNIHLFEWPFRKLKFARTEALTAKLRKHRITQAWAGSFEAVLHKQLDLTNRRLAEECQTHGGGVLVPIGSVNTAWPDWEEDLRRCHEQYRMRALRLYPAYHGYADHPESRGCLQATEAGPVQIVMRWRRAMHHQAINVCNASPSARRIEKNRRRRLQLIIGACSATTFLTWSTRTQSSILPPEGNGGVGRLIEGKNPSYRGAIPVERLLFALACSFSPCESAVKLFESPLILDQLEKLMSANARLDGLVRLASEVPSPTPNPLRKGNACARCSRVCLGSGRVRPADARRPGEAKNMGHPLSRLLWRRYPPTRRKPVLCGADGDRADALPGHRRLAK